MYFLGESINVITLIVALGNGTWLDMLSNALVLCFCFFMYQMKLATHD